MLCSYEVSLVFQLFIALLISLAAFFMYLQEGPAGRAGVDISLPAAAASVLSVHTLPSSPP